jgi:hypothetical protein
MQVEALQQLGDPSVANVLPTAGESGADYTGMSSNQWAALTPQQQNAAVRSTFLSNLSTALNVSPSASNGSSSTAANTQGIEAALNARLENAVASKGIDTGNWDQVGRAGQRDLVVAALQNLQSTTSATDQVAA